ncbi:MAG TPA: ABC transporter permease [Humisphaera sp.]|nr:ABC transporter permease [Humisphaera sp.]
MIPVLLLLCVLFSILTWTEQYPTGASAARQFARLLTSDGSPHLAVLIVVRDGEEDAAFADTLRQELLSRKAIVVGVVRGQPIDARKVIAAHLAAGEKIDVIAANEVTAAWGLFDHLGESFPALANVRIVKPAPYHWPNFLKTENLLNIANQIAVIAIIAIGMTMVIITGGIDLSVGSLIALSSVVSAYLIRGFGGARDASTLAMIACCLAGLLTCAFTGLFTGTMVTLFRVPSFIVTLAIMLIASGLAYRISDSQSINQVPDRFVWLGRGANLGGIPNAVALMLLLYAAAHVLMSRTAVGRYIYAVGGNAEAARLSGVPIRRVLLFVYCVSGALAGLGGVIMASLLKSGAPTYGQMYELYVIAAVVVGGTSLAGGQGKIFGTLVGALIIAVIQNGMNLCGVESNNQKIVLGGVILGAVLLDQIRK